MISYLYVYKVWLSIVSVVQSTTCNLSQPVPYSKRPEIHYNLYEEVQEISLLLLQNKQTEVKRKKKTVKKKPNF